jgi:HAD superfamily hydrolase (TIGR01509 family)
MTNSPQFPNIKAVVFDYGNTLIAFGRAQVDEFDRRLGKAVEGRYGTLDRQRYNAHRNADRMAPYAGDPPAYRESDPVEMTAALIRALYTREARPDELAALLEARRAAFVAVAEAEPAVAVLLAALRLRFKLGLLSNYPDGVAIRRSLDRTRLTPHFDSVVVSGDLGLVKPHPDTFAASLRELGAAPEETLFVGDNWLADVQGAKRAGMRVVHFTRWAPPEHFDRLSGDAEPDATIARLDELPPLLGLGGGEPA